MNDEQAVKVLADDGVPIDTMMPPSRSFVVIKSDQSIELIWKGSAAPGTVLGTFALTKQVLVEHLDKLLDDQLREHLRTGGIEKRLTDMMDRRIELALKHLEEHLTRTVGAAVHQAAVDRVREAVKNMPIDVTITTRKPLETPANGHTPHP